MKKFTSLHHMPGCLNKNLDWWTDKDFHADAQYLFLFHRILGRATGYFRAAFSIRNWKNNPILGKPKQSKKPVIPQKVGRFPMLWGAILEKWGSQNQAMI